ncbi:uncharacterized protein SPPG_02918 [Spizellomyces punctatus DAOM BR117]|uniref:Uncharacterized protein n=1 Tax=Spizellomyces punctatus (strain DAOM BR117) TaxID=645134 RepID=A0A0L0HN11_SPIPD|nr:uncharacterized protein SPPG_02918 [Spizellomyces punctatus DAOM BR117]KND02453.1 hypothetical protein SPPG_02918 [Spizellomyces punctatus DAOM BR117]|eukprot:XP_016610492.1 hypothetical protein SPPG_02918 [Spizellomyces punctatus DAOM BR117]
MSALGEEDNTVKTLSLSFGGQYGLPVAKSLEQRLAEENPSLPSFMVRPSAHASLSAPRNNTSLPSTTMSSATVPTRSCVRFVDTSHRDFFASKEYQAHCDFDTPNQAEGARWSTLGELAHQLSFALDLLEFEGGRGFEAEILRVAVDDIIDATLEDPEVDVDLEVKVQALLDRTRTLIDCAMEHGTLNTAKKLMDIYGMDWATARKLIESGIQVRALLNSSDPIGMLPENYLDPFQNFGLKHFNRTKRMQAISRQDCMSILEKLQATLATSYPELKINPCGSFARGLPMLSVMNIVVPLDVSDASITAERMMKLFVADDLVEGASVEPLSENQYLALVPLRNRAVILDLKVLQFESQNDHVQRG